jgi:hypothetical protein
MASTQVRCSAFHVAWLMHLYVDIDLYKLPVSPNLEMAGILLCLFCPRT